MRPTLQLIFIYACIHVVFPETTNAQTDVNVATRNRSVAFRELRRFATTPGNKDTRIELRLIDDYSMDKPYNESALFTKMIVSDDKQAIDLVRSGLQAASVRPPRISPPAAEMHPYGELLLHNEGGDIRIILGNYFAVKSAHAVTWNDIFISKKLAAAVEGLLRRQFDVGLTPTRLGMLSGEHHRQQQIVTYSSERFGNTPLLQRNASVAKVATRDPFDADSFRTSPFGTESAAWQYVEAASAIRPQKVKVRLIHHNPFAAQRTIWFEGEATDDVSLTRAQRGLQVIWKKAPQDAVSQFGAIPHGEVEFHWARDTLKIYLIGPFQLGADGSEDSLFSSWPLAEVVNDIILKGTGSGMTKAEFASCSGQPIAEIR